MKKRIRTSRLATSAVVATAAVGGVLALAGGASAAVFNPVDGPQLDAAVASANANTDPSNTIKVPCSTTLLPSKQIVNTRTNAPLTVSGPTAVPGQVCGDPKIDGTNVTPVPSPMFNVPVNTTLNVDHIIVTTGGGLGVPGGFQVFGTLNVDKSEISGNNSDNIVVKTFGVLNMTNSTDDGASGVGLLNQGTANLTNTTVATNIGGGIATDGGRLNLRNSIVAFNNPFVNGSKDCLGPINTGVTLNSEDTDGTCGVGALSATDPLFGPPPPIAGGGTLIKDGGVTSMFPLTASSPGVAAGVSCLAQDQRDINRAGHGACSIGSYQFTPPTCVLTAIRRNDPNSTPPNHDRADVTVEGFGAGLASISNVVITNGTFFAPALTLNPLGGQLGPIITTATKTTQGVRTSFSFNATDVEGNITNCV